MRMILKRELSIFIYLIGIANTISYEQYWSNSFRKLFSSNCIIIEKGKIPRYYACEGCVIEEALGCVNDLRFNKSSNVHPYCDMQDLRSSYQSDYCCPKFGYTKASPFKLDLLYIGSAYPEALRCLEFIGCGTSTIYNELLNECEYACPSPTYVDQNGENVCFANFNSSYRLTSKNIFQLIFLNIFFISMYFLLT